MTERIQGYETFQAKASDKIKQHITEKIENLKNEKNTLNTLNLSKQDLQEAYVVKYYLYRLLYESVQTQYF